MHDKIKANISNPEMLEKLYRDDRKAFEAAFERIYPEIENTELAKFLPFYLVWIIIVILAFPVIFGMK